MKCIACGSEIAENMKFCTTCGAPVSKPEPVFVPDPVVVTEPVKPVVEVPPVAPVRPDPAPVQPRPVIVQQQPAQPKLLGPWAYYGLQLLFSIPLVGFICLIVFSLDDSNLNRRNYARSYWCSLIVSLVIIIALVVLLLATGAGAALISELENISL